MTRYMGSDRKCNAIQFIFNRVYPGAKTSARWDFLKTSHTYSLNVKLNGQTWDELTGRYVQSCNVDLRHMFKTSYLVM